jgi:predicted dehydrogenase
MEKHIWLIGAGYMAKEYAKVLTSLQIPFTVISRGEENCKKIADEFNCKYIAGGLDQFLATRPAMPPAAIVAVGIEALSAATTQLVKYGVKYILLEKPGIGYPVEIDALVQTAQQAKATVVLAYNRRFYASVLKAEELIAQDGGVTSFNFEFTEWSHVIRTLVKTKEEWHNWFLGNSTHVIDTAFFLGGKPAQLSAYYKGSLDWHPASASFSGAGISDKDALFSYHANWEAPGRWVIEILTTKNRLIFKPMESLQIQAIGSVAVNPVELDDALDKQFKPGIYLQTKAFLEHDLTRFCDIAEQKEMIDKYYLTMSGYSR